MMNGYMESFLTLFIPVTPKNFACMECVREMIPHDLQWHHDNTIGHW